MTPTTPTVHPDLERLAEGTLGREAREAALDHLVGCADCRRRWLADDPTRAFALLGRAPVPEPVLDGVVDGVRRETAPRRRVAAGAWAAAILIVATLVGFGLQKREPVIVAEALELDARPRGTLALLESPGEAEVVDLAVGENQVVMIFDQEFDL